jgi:hypothetical protein
MMQVDATAAGSLEPIPPLDALFEWELFASFPNHLAAHIMAELLENEGVPTMIEFRGVFTDTERACSAWVPKPLAHRVRWIMALEPPTESELVFLATGELPAERSV